jgi:hypothetical protein
VIEITRNYIKRIDVPHHLIKEERNKFGGYEDIDGNQISGKTHSKDLCIKCYNDFFTAGLEKVGL